MTTKIHVYDEPIPGVLIRRYKRFLADVSVSGKTQTIFCPNSGSMLGCAVPGSDVMVSPAQTPGGKTRYTLEMVKADGVWVGVNTLLTNRLACSIIDASLIRDFPLRVIRKEVAFGESRLDILLGDGEGLCYAEVKTVSLRDAGGIARFPDARTERGRKHLGSLMEALEQGYRAAMIFVVQRSDCRGFGPADAIDPEYGRTLRTAIAGGVEVHALLCEVRPEGIWFLQKLQVAF